MSNQTPNFTRFQDGRFPVLNIPEGNHLMKRWKQGHSLASTSFDNVNTAMDLLETCRKRVLHVKKTVGFVRGTLPKCDQHPLPEGEIPEVSHDEATNALRYRFEIARSSLEVMIRELEQAIIVMAQELKANGIENPDHRPGSMDADTVRLFRHHVLMALEYLKLARADNKVATAYLKELPTFPFDVEKTYVSGSFDFKHMGL